MPLPPFAACPATFLNCLADCRRRTFRYLLPFLVPRFVTADTGRAPLEFGRATRFHLPRYYTTACCHAGRSLWVVKTNHRTTARSSLADQANHSPDNRNNGRQSSLTYTKPPIQPPITTDSVLT